VAYKSELTKRTSDYAQKYGFLETQHPIGFEAYVVHLFAQEDGLDAVLGGQDTFDADLSESILHSDDLGVDGVLVDDSAKRIVIIQATMQAADKLPDS
jgi:hypothetical protein